MPGRKPGELPSFERGWSRQLGKELTEFLARIRFGMSGLQGDPETPSQIKAGEVASNGNPPSQVPAPSNHVHDADTGAPTNYVALGGALAEGTGSALMRASATNVLAQGGAVSNDQLQWNGSAWAPSDDAEVLNWMNL